MYIKPAIFFVSTLFAIQGFSQPLPLPRNIREAYDNGTRSADGRPGKNYWQNAAAYLLNIQFDPHTRLLNGDVSITYTNNSPDTLTEIWFKLYPNLYAKGSPRAQQIEREDIGDGVQITGMTIGNAAQDLSKLEIQGTNMTVHIEPLPHGESRRFHILYSYTLNRGSHIRTGQIDSNSDFVAYFFPRIAVYDDIDGWNTYPYNGSQEFYNDFCTFRANISVPSNFVVWATGDLLNCNEVFTEKYCRRIRQAETNDSITDIIDTSDLQRQDITANKEINTWQFQASGVTDFVFATSDHYVWKSSSLVVDQKTGRRTRVDAAFNPVHRDYFDVINQARATVLHMSDHFPGWPYPYPHETVFDGLDQMEYPMMVNDNPLEDREDAIELTDHEIFHTMFPFYMGINETKYAWMDEGWATIGEWLISPMIDSNIVDEYGVKPYASNAGTEIDLPIRTLSTQLTGTAYFLNSYPKPAFGYLYIKDMLGDALFMKALHYYIEQWNGKHPMPFDFFHCMNTGSGRNLNWFWKRWFFDDGVPDLGISRFTRSGNTNSAEIKLKGNKPVPVWLTVFYADGTSEKIHRTIAVWEKKNTVTVSFSSGKKVRKLLLDDPHVPDADRSDNEYLVK